MSKPPGLSIMLDCFNRSATKDNTGWRSPYEVFFSRLPALPVVPFFQEGMMRVDHSSKSDVQSVLCKFLNGGHNHPSSAVKVTKASMDGICYTSDVEWTVPPAIAGGSVFAAAPATSVLNMNYVPPPPPIRSSELQPLPPPLQPPPPPLPPSQSSSLPPAVVLPRPHTEPQRISSRTRSKTVQVSDALTSHLSGKPEVPVFSPPVPSDQGLHHSVGLLSMMSKTAMLSMVTTRGAVDAGRRNKPPSFGAAGSRHFPLGTAKGHHRLGGGQGGSMRYGGDACHSGGHRRDLGRPAAALQAAGFATLLRL